MDPWIFYTWTEWDEIAEQEELTPSLITFRRKIRAETLPKGKQLKYEEEIYRITIIKCPTCEKMVEQDDDYYCPPIRETVEETGLTTAPKYLCKDDRFNCDLYTTDIGERKPE